MSSTTSGSGPRRAWKFLDDEGRGMVSRLAWPTPAADGGPGAWVEAGGPLEVCVRGIHACRADDLAWWLSAQLWEIELDGRILDDTYSLVAERGRLSRPVAGWPEVGVEMAEWSIWRARDRAVAVLAGVDPARAAALEAATTLGELRSAVPADATADLATPEQLALALLDYQLTHAENPVLTCVSAAHAAANLASVTGGRDETRQAMADERLAQSRWLRDRLSLAG